MKQALAAMMLTAIPTLTAASTDEAWAEFRQAVKTACRDRIDAPDGAVVSVEVNPFGSDSYGAALVEVASAEGTDRMVCIYDKQSGEAEITAPFTDAAPVE